MDSYSLGILIVLNRPLTEIDWEGMSSDFTQQVNSIGTTLEPGQIGSIRIAASPATELILLPAYCTIDDLTPIFRDCPNGMLERLAAIQHSKKSPVLLWVESSKVLFTADLKLKIGVNLCAKRWDIRGGKQIQVRKEEQSSNGFLSVYFLD